MHITAEPGTLKLVLKLSEIAEQCGVHPRTIQRMISRGEFPAPTCRFGRIPAWAPSLIAQWAAGEWTPPAGPARRARKAGAKT
jgi:predicted DNA-binding transcriptional regulator AlpA